GDPLPLRRATCEAERRLHVHLVADLPETHYELVQGDRQVGDVDEHRHDEETLHHALLDVLDVDVAGREVRGDARHHALLIAADHGDDGPVAHAETLAARRRRVQASYVRPVRRHHRTLWPGACRKMPPSR